MYPLIRKTLFLTTLCILFVTKAYASAETDFNKGHELFKAGKYSLAAEKFESARKQGMKTVALYYNLASTYFKLEEYRGARHYFKLVAKTPSMRELAEYNLGLIELKEGNKNRASEYFSAIVNNSNDEKLIRLSKKQLITIKTLDDKVKVFVSANLGHDDNITASPSDTIVGSSDSYYDVFLSADALISGKRKNGWMVDATYFKIDFSDTDTFDEYQYAVGITNAHKLSTWGVNTHLTYSQNYFGGVNYQNAIKLDIRGKKSLTKTEKLYLRYRYEDISSQDVIYDYLEGTRQRFRIDYRNYARKNIKQIYYELELNDRGYLNTLAYAYDYSPTRHSIRGKYTHIFNDTWHLIGDLSYRMSDFPSSSTPVLFDRDDKRIKSSIALDYRLDKTFKIRTKIQHTNNESTEDQYDYDKTQITVGVTKRF